MASDLSASPLGALSLKAFGDKIIIRPDDEAPGFEVTELQRGTVVAVGNGYWSGGMQVKLKVGEGDTVFYTGGLPLEFEGQRYVGIAYSDLYGGFSSGRP